MFPEADLPGRGPGRPGPRLPRHPRRPGRRAGADPRPRGPHRRRALRAAAGRRAGVRHPVHAGAGRTQDRGARPRARRPRPHRGAGRSRRRRARSEIEFIRVTHSMPDCVAVAIHTPQGVLVHTGDFKIDYTPLDHQPTDLGRLAELGAGRRAGALCRQHQRRSARRHRLGDRRRATPSTRCSPPPKASWSSPRSRRASTACSSSSTWRPSSIAGWPSSAAGCRRTREIAQRLGYLRVPTGVGIKDADVGSFPAGDVVCLVTGSQGEPQAALSRIAIDDHRHVSLGPDDTVVLSARAIPGNEKADRPGRQPPGPAPGRSGDRGDRATSTCRATAASRS